MVVHFFKTLDEKVDGPKPPNLGDLLMGFLDLYGRKLNYEMVGLKVKDGIFAKKCDMVCHMSTGLDSRHPPPLLCIEDPLNERNNVSKSSYKVQDIRNAFKTAYEVLESAIQPNKQTVLKNRDHNVARIECQIAWE